MKTCPRCGATREDATPLETQPSSSETPPQPAFESLSGAAAGKPDTDVVPLSAIRQQRVNQRPSEFSPASDMVFLSPNEAKRRFPLFTSAQLTLIAIGTGLIMIMLVIAYLLWRQQQRDIARPMVSPAAAIQPSPVVSPTPDPSPTPTPTDDAALMESVKASLLAYNPLGFTHYKLEIKEGVVTISGEAEHQPEKDGAENVVKLVTGVKSVVNNLKVKPEQPSAPVKLNPAEARLLDDALRKQIQTDEQNRNDQSRQSPQDPQREAERQRREQMIAKQREEDLAQRKAAEDKLRREAEDYEKRQEELRRTEAERRARAEQAKLEASILRSGTVAWSGAVDGIDEIILSGSSASVRHLSGAPPREVRVSFSAPIPRSPVIVKLVTTSGRGQFQIVQQPSASNGYSTIIRIDDSGKGGDKRHEFTLRWSLP